MPTSAAPTSGAGRRRRARKNRKGHPPEHEALESPQHEASEVREGTEDSECCAEKQGKSKCSACAAGKPCSGRSDALTAQDYLLACDLGIADRSRPYIRARLDAMTSIRSDKKCGNSYIPNNAQCRAGAGAEPSGGSRLRKGLEVAGMAGGAALYGAGAVQAMRSASKGNVKGAFRSIAAANAGGTLANAALLSRAKRTGDDKLATRAKAGMALGYLGSGAALAGSGDLSAAGGAIARGARRAAGRVGRIGEGRRTTAIVPYSGNGGGGRTTATRAGSLGNRARRAYNTAFGQNASGRQARQGIRSAMTSATFATRRGSNFTAANSLGNRARRAAYTYGGGLQSVAASAASEARNAFARRPAPFRRRGGAIVPYGRRDSVWADGFNLDPQVLTY